MARSAIDQQLRRLREEVARLERAAAALAGASARRPGRPRPAAKRASKSSRPRSATGRGRAGGGRSAQALRLVSANPGITVRELAAKMKIKPNYLYRVLPALEAAGKVRKQSGGWHAVG